MIDAGLGYHSLIRPYQQDGLRSSIQGLINVYWRPFTIFAE